MSKLHCGHSIADLINGQCTLCAKERFENAKQPSRHRYLCALEWWGRECPDEGPPECTCDEGKAELEDLLRRQHEALKEMEQHHRQPCIFTDARCHPADRARAVLAEYEEMMKNG